MIRHGVLEARVASLAEVSETEFARWRALSAIEPHLSCPFLSAHFFETVARAHPGARVCIIRTGDSIIGFFPFQFVSRLHQALAVAAPLGEVLAGYCGMIATADLRLDGRTLLRLASLTYLRFVDLDESQLAYGLKGERARRAFVMRLEEGGEKYWDDLKRTDRKFVSDTQRSERQLEEAHGPLQFCYAQRETQSHLDNLIAIKRLQYQRTGRADWLAAPWRREVLARLAATSAAAGCRSVLSTLYAGETWVASHFGLENQGVLYYWYPVYNPEFSRFSPGRLLLKKMIECSESVGLKAIDFGAGDNQYKQKFGNDERQVFRGTWYRPGVRSTAYRVVCSARWRWAALQSRRAQPPNSSSGETPAR